MADTPVQVKSAPAWFPNVIVVPAGNVPVQVAGQRPGRVTIAGVNTGANAATINNAAVPSNPGLPLAAGQPFALDTEGEVYATSVAGTTIEIVETAFNPAGPSAGGGPLPSYQAAFGKSL